MVTSIAILYDGDVDEYDGDSEVLYHGERVTRLATYTRVDGSENPHDKVRLESLFHYNEYDQSVWLKDSRHGPIVETLFEALVAAKHVEFEGEYIVVKVRGSGRLQST